jgi:hypothetical protein
MITKALHSLQIRKANGVAVNRGIKAFSVFWVPICFSLRGLAFRVAKSQSIDIIDCGQRP